MYKKCVHEYLIICPTKYHKDMLFKILVKPLSKLINTVIRLGYTHIVMTI